MENCNANTLSEVVEQYCLHQFNDRKKNFAHYLPMAKKVWEDIFLRTIWNSKSKWAALQTATPYPYIDLPKGISTFLGVFGVDDCGNLFPLQQNNRINIIPKPVTKSCGCTQSCSCGSMCAGMNTLSFTSTDVLIDGVTYPKRTWLQICSTGEVRKWTETPTKNYTDAAHFTIDYSKDFSAVCTLQVLPCGCVAQSDLNANLIADKCGDSLVATCATKITDIPQKHGVEQYKFSECGTKLYIIGAKTTDYLVHYQTVAAADDSLVPHYCLDAMFDGLLMRSTLWNPTKNASEKEYAKMSYRKGKEAIIKFLNPVSLEQLSRIQGERKPW